MNRRFSQPLRRRSADYLIIVTLLLLVLFGLVMLASASSHAGRVKHGDAAFYLKHQLLSGLLPGAAGFAFAFFFWYRRYEKLSIPLLLGSLGLLFLVFTPLGVTAGGAARWLALGPVSFQPSEILKLTFVLYLASWLARPKGRERRFVQGFFPFLIVSGLIAGILLEQHSTSVAFILLLTALILYFVSGAKMTYVGGALLAGAAVFAMIVMATPYRRERILSYLRPELAPEAGGFHLTQAKTAIGAGGLTGVGYGRSTTKISYLPEPIGDSIFAVIAEELGFAGVLFLIGLFCLLLGRMFMLAFRVRDRFAHLLLVGFASLIAAQTLLHLGAITGLLPMTGVALPFISYGGTALAVFMTMIGIVANISRTA